MWDTLNRKKAAYVFNGFTRGCIISLKHKSLTCQSFPRLEYYYALGSVGRRVKYLAGRLLCFAIKPLMLRSAGPRLLFAIDDTPTKHYGPRIEGASLHHNPSPGPSGEIYLYGHLWVVLAWVAIHPTCDVITLPPAGGVILGDRAGTGPLVAVLLHRPDLGRGDDPGNDGGAIKQTFKALKEVWGVQQQQLRHLYACVGAMNLCIWLFNLVEIWAWDKSDDEIIDRGASPWDSEPRRASHADKRKALQRNILRAEIEAVIKNGPDTGEFRASIERLLALAL